MATLIDQLSESLHLPAVTGFRARLPGWLVRFNAYRQKRRDQALILHHLAQAEDRELRDLNISRYDFEAIAKGKFRR